MRLALAIVLTTFVHGAVAEAGKAKAPRKTGVKFMVDKVNKHGQVVERVVVSGPLGRTRGKTKARKARRLTMEQQVKAMIGGVAVDETAAAMPDDPTIGGRLEEVGSLTSQHNGSTITRTEYRRKGAYHQGTGVETRVYARGKLRRIRPAEVLAEPQMLGKGGALAEATQLEVPAAEGEDGQQRWGMLSAARLEYTANRPHSLQVFVFQNTPIQVDRDLVSQALRTGRAGTGDLIVESDGEHVHLLHTHEGRQQEYRLPHEQVKAFLQKSYKSVPRGDEARWMDLDAELGGLQ